MKNPQVESTDATSGHDLTPPHGLDKIIATFGNIYEYIGTDGQLAPHWQSDFLAKTSLPFPMRLAWDPARVITRMTCHRLMTGIYASVFAGIQKNGLESKVVSFGGCFAFRPQRTGSKLSAHSWGIAIDLNPQTNAQGSAGMPGWLKSFVLPDLSGEETGTARLAIPCTFNSARRTEARPWTSDLNRPRVVFGVTYPTARADLRKLDSTGIVQQVEQEFFREITYYCPPIYAITFEEIKD